MRPLVSTFLVPFLLAGQLIAAAPHWHGEASGTAGPSHDEQAHIHLHALSGHHLHEHEHATTTKSTTTTPAPESVPDEHDGDAVYVTDVDVLNDGGSVKVPELAVSLLLVVYFLPTLGELVHHDGQWSSSGDEHLMRPKCALYQQLLSIRC